MQFHWILCFKVLFKYNVILTSCAAWTISYWNLPNIQFVIFNQIVFKQFHQIYESCNFWEWNIIRPINHSMEAHQFFCCLQFHRPSNLIFIVHFPTIYLLTRKERASEKQLLPDERSFSNLSLGIKYRNKIYYCCSSSVIMGN